MSCPSVSILMKSTLDDTTSSSAIRRFVRTGAAPWLYASLMWSTRSTFIIALDRGNGSLFFERIGSFRSSAGNNASKPFAPTNAATYRTLGRCSSPFNRATSLTYGSNPSAFNVSPNTDHQCAMPPLAPTSTNANGFCHARASTRRLSTADCGLMFMFRPQVAQSLRIFSSRGAVTVRNVLDSRLAGQATVQQTPEVDDDHAARSIGEMTRH